MPKSAKRSLLWSVKSDRLPGTSYVFGTMHVRDARAFQRLEAVYRAIADCAAYAAEFDLQEAPPVVDPQVLLLPDGKSLAHLIPPKKYDKLRQALHKYLQLDLAPFQHHRPLLLANLIEERLLARDQPYALDEHLWQYAQQLDKQLFGIETLQEQMQVLQRIPLSLQVQSLLSTLRHFPRHRQHLRNMARWYEQGDIFRLYQATRRGSHHLRHLLLYDRNKVMAERIFDLSQSQSTFCAIGAAHLAGQKGVLRLLKIKGLRIQPISL